VIPDDIVSVQSVPAARLPTEVTITKPAVAEPEAISKQLKEMPEQPPDPVGVRSPVQVAHGTFKERAEPVFIGSLILKVNVITEAVPVTAVANTSSDLVKASGNCVDVGIATATMSAEEARVAAAFRVGSLADCEYLLLVMPVPTFTVQVVPPVRSPSFAVNTRCAFAVPELPELASKVVLPHPLSVTEPGVLNTKSGSVRVTASLISITVFSANWYSTVVTESETGVLILKTLVVKTMDCIVNPDCPVNASVSVAVAMLNVTTVPPAPLTARFDEHVRTAGWPPFREAPNVTVSAAPTVAAPETVTGAPVLVRAQVVAASVVKRFDEGVIVTV